MTHASRIKWFTMKDKVGDAPAWLRDYIADTLLTARKIYPPRSTERAFYMGIARATASMWAMVKQ